VELILLLIVPLDAQCAVQYAAPDSTQTVQVQQLEQLVVFGAQDKMIQYHQQDILDVKPIMVPIQLEVMSVKE